MTQPPGEKRLVRRLKRYDEHAFREMVRTYEQPVFNIVYRMLGNRSEAEDLAQEVFITVFKTITTFREESKFSTWLFRIAVNHCRNRHKYLSRRKQHSTQSLGDHNVSTDNAAPGFRLHGEVSRPDTALECRRLEAAVQREIDQLNDEHRMLIVLRDIQGMSYQDIAGITRLAEGTVKSRLHRARMALKDRLDKHL